MSNDLQDVRIRMSRVEEKIESLEWWVKCFLFVFVVLSFFGDRSTKIYNDGVNATDVSEPKITATDAANTSKIIIGELNLPAKYINEIEKRHIKYYAADLQLPKFNTSIMLNDSVQTIVFQDKPKSREYGAMGPIGPNPHATPIQITNLYGTFVLSTLHACSSVRQPIGQIQPFDNSTDVAFFDALFVSLDSLFAFQKRKHKHLSI